MKSFLTKHVVAIVVGAVVVVSAGGSVWYIASNHAPSFATTVATRGDVISSLDEAGTVAAENNADLSFQEGGQIAQVYVTEGQTVSAGTALASLSNASLEAGLQEASASLAAAQANLDNLTAGTRSQQLTIDQTAVTNAQTALSVDMSNAYSAADDAIRNQTDNLFENPESNGPVLLVPITNTQMLNNIESGRVTMEATLDAWYAAQNSSSSASMQNQATLTATTNTSLSQVQAYLDQLALAVNDASPTGQVTAATLAGYKVNIATARTEVDAAISTVTGAESALQSAQNTLALAQAGSTPQQIEAQQAVVDQAQAGVTSAQVALNNSVLTAPFSGTIQNLTAQIGQVVSPGAPVLSLVNNNGLKIEAYASEADVANIADGDSAQVTLDAFGTGTDFPATVSTIDTAETDVNGTPAYLVTLHFTNPEPQAKDGMTGNVHIILAEHDNVVEVPSRLVINNGNNYFVLVATATGTQEEPVQIGLVGDNGMTEITSGINVGDQLANF